MLRALADLAERQNLVSVAGYENKPVDFEIQIDREGKFVALVSRRGEDGKGQKLLIPRIPGRTVAVTPGFLVDNSKYVLGVDDPAKANPERLQRCVEAFAAVIHAAARPDEPALAAVGLFYERLAENRNAILVDRPASEWNGSEILVFGVVGLGLVHERDEVRAYLRQAREGETAVAGVRCLVSGRIEAPARLHPPIKRVPGGQSSGTMLVSFNADAFGSHGLGQGENAPISEAAAVAYTSALNFLLERAPGAKRPHQFGVSLGSDSVACYWTTAPREALGFFDSLWNDARPEDANALLNAAWSAEPPPELDEERFYVVTLSGNAARVVVRDWFEATVGHLKTSVRRYFDDLAVGSHPQHHPIWQLVQAIEPPGNAIAPPALATRLFLASIKGTPLPRELLRHALLRLRTGWDDGQHVVATRVALIKATLRGIGRSDAAKPHLQEVTVSLDENSLNSAYNLGRLFAALEKAQLNALGDINATIRDRYFGAASTTPSVVFPRLIRMAQHHVSKARDLNRDYGIEKVIAQIIDRLPSAGFPSILGLEDQGLFAVGYYHQRETFYVKKAS